MVMLQIDIGTDKHTDRLIAELSVCPYRTDCVAGGLALGVAVSSADDAVQLRDDRQLRVDLHRGSLPAHAALCCRLLREQRSPLVHRVRLE